MNSLYISVLCARYLHNTQFLEVIPKIRDSSFWKAILSLKELLWKGDCYIVGDGCSIDPWKYPWVPNERNFLPISTSKPSVGNVRVTDFFLQQGMWDLNKLSLKHSPADVQLISSINLPLKPKPDHCMWTPMSDEKFSSRSAYFFYNKLRFTKKNQMPKEIWLKF